MFCVFLCVFSVSLCRHRLRWWKQNSITFGWFLVLICKNRVRWFTKAWRFCGYIFYKPSRDRTRPLGRPRGLQGLLHELNATMITYGSGTSEDIGTCIHGTKASKIWTLRQRPARPRRDAARPRPCLQDQRALAGLARGGAEACGRKAGLTLFTGFWLVRGLVDLG